jgi:steroid delta-isomerase
MRAMASGNAARRGGLALFLALTLAPWLSASAKAAEDAAAAAIRATLAGWTARFNAGEAAQICDLFAPDLRYQFGAYPERGYDELCALLRRSLADPAKRYRYALEIDEIIVSGDLAVVRLVWTLETRGRDGRLLAREREPGMDVLRRERDGAWTIFRYLAYQAPARSPSGQP